MISKNDYEMLLYYLPGDKEVPEEYNPRYQNLRDKKLLEIDIRNEHTEVRYYTDVWGQSREETVTKGDYFVKVSYLGEDAISEFEDARDKDAKQEKQQSFSNKISVMNVLSAFAIFFIGVIFERFSKISDFFAGLFS